MPRKCLNHPDRFNPDRLNHPHRKKNSHVPGIKNVQHISLVNPDKVLMPPVHINLGLMKNFVKAMAKHRSEWLEISLQKVFQTKPSQVERRILCWFTYSKSF